MNSTGSEMIIEEPERRNGQTYEEWREEQRQKRIAIASKENPTSDDIWDLFECTDLDVRRDIYETIRRFDELNALLSFLDEFHTSRFTEEELEKYNEFLGYIAKLTDEMYYKVRFFEL